MPSHRAGGAQVRSLAHLTAFAVLLALASLAWADVPSSPRNLKAEKSDRGVKVDFDLPVSNGGKEIQVYEVTAVEDPLLKARGRKPRLWCWV
jgi:hypothetical protein